MASSISLLYAKVLDLKQRLIHLTQFDPADHPRWPVRSVGGRGGRFMPLGRIAKAQLEREIAVLEQAKIAEQKKLDIARSKPRNPVTGNRAGVHQVEISRIDLLIKAKQAELTRGIEPEFNILPRVRGTYNPPHARGPAPKRYDNDDEVKE